MYLFAALCFLCSCETTTISDSGNSNTGTGGSMAKFTCKGNYLYVVDDANLQTFDISDSSKILLKSRISVGRNLETLFPTDTLLFMGSTSGMIIYSLKNPAIPRYVSQYDHITSCDPVVVKGQYAFVTLRSNAENWSCARNVNELQVIDISNIHTPINKATYPMTNPKGLAVDDSLLFVCDGMSLKVMNAKNPLTMTTLKTFELDGTPYDLIAKNGLLTITYSLGIKQYAYTGDTIRLLSTIY